jgi:polysaccharide export outer membrane protein
MRRTGAHLRFAAAALLIAMLAALAGPAAVRAADPPKELVTFVEQAIQSGFKPEAVRQTALRAGWAADAVDAVLARRQSLELPSPAKPPEEAHRDNLRNVPEDYVIGEGDVIQISVWREPDASVTAAVVRPDGRISMPLLKQIHIAGMTLADAEILVARQLAAFIHEPDVTVVIKEIHSKKVYVVGAVKKEGPLPYTYRMTVLQALSEAGGLNDYARRKKIYVLRSRDGKQARVPFDYDAVLKGERVELNIELLPGDSVVVPH